MIAERSELEPVEGALDDELERRREVLRALETELTRHEGELESLLDELSVFERRYAEVLGDRYRRLAELVREVGERRTAHQEREPDDGGGEPTGQGDGTSPGGEGDEDGWDRPARLGPSDSARRLFRRLARRIHPDLAADEAERARRTRLMMAANQAYQDGDVERLRALLEDEELGSDGAVGDGELPDLVRIVRRINRATRRLEAVRGELRALRESAMGMLLVESAEAGARGFDLLADMAVELDRLIERTEAELEELAV